MKYRFARLLAAFWLAVYPLWGMLAQTTTSLQNISTFVLDNGLRVVLLENHDSPEVAFRLWVDVPLRLEKQWAGVSALAGAMLTAGALALHKGRISALADGLGATLRSDANGVWISGGSRYKEPMMALLAELSLRATFPDSAWSAVQEAYLKQLAGQLDKPRGIVQGVARAVTYGEAHPYGERPEPANVRQIRADQARAYYKQYFLPSLSFLVMAGDINGAEARRLAELHWGGWPRQDAFKEFFSRPEPPIALEVGLVSMSQADSACFELAYPLRLKPGTLDELRANALSIIFSERLQQAWPAAGAYAAWQADVHSGYFHLGGCSPPGQLDSLIQRASAELTRLRQEPVTEAELLRAKAIMEAGYTAGIAHSDGWADMALKTVRFRLPVDFYPTYSDKIGQLSVADLLEVAQTFVRPEQANLIVVGPPAIAERLRQFSAEKKVRHYDVYGHELQMAGSLLPEGLSADDIIQNYIDAIGGMEKLEAVSSIQQVMFTTLQGLDMEMKLIKRSPGQLAIEVTAGDLLINATRFDGEKAMVAVMGDTQRVDRQGLIDLRDQALLFPELTYAANGYSAELVASDIINNTQVYVVDITGPEGIAKTEYYDASTWLKVRTVVTRGEITAVNDYASYQAVDGILFPFILVSTGLTPQPITFEIEQIDLNKPLDDQLFRVQE